MLQKNTFDWMRQQLNGYMRTQVIAAAATFSLAGHLQNGPLTVEEIASITGLNREITFRESKREYHRPLRRLGLIYLITTCITPKRLRSSKRQCKLLPRVSRRRLDSALTRQRASWPWMSEAPPGRCSTA